MRKKVPKCAHTKKKIMTGTRELRFVLIAAAPFLFHTSTRFRKKDMGQHKFICIVGKKWEVCVCDLLRLCVWLLPAFFLCFLLYLFLWSGNTNAHEQGHPLRRSVKRVILKCNEEKKTVVLCNACMSVHCSWLLYYSKRKEEKKRISPFSSPISCVALFPIISYPSLSRLAC